VSENRYPIHARGPPRNVSRLPQMPGMVLTASGTDSHRSGLRCYGQVIEQPCGGYHVLEFQSVFPPERLGSVHSEYGHHDCLTFGDPAEPNIVSQNEGGRKGETCLIPSCTLPFLSVNGVFNGKMSSFIAIRIVDGTGACTRNVSRTT